ncbi:MAG: prolipoprotein diacylglyceryl transferase, partial [Nitrospira sp.]|nr:prolipoprotein diacylglyceryl transferase [Nitrospira sp.]
MDPVIFQIGPFALRYYGLMYALAALVGGWLLGKEARRKGIPLTDDQRWNLILFVLFGGILGARIYYVAFNWDYYGKFPSEIPAIWHGGLAIHGGLIGGVLIGIWYVRRHRLPFWKLADAGAPSTILGQAFGRFGNFMNGDAHGIPTTKPWGIVFPPGSIAGHEFPGISLHPVMLYELVLDLAGFFLLWSIRKKPWADGFIFCSYLLLYSVIRFFVSFFRADDLYMGPFRAPHVVSVLLLVIVGTYVIKN